MTLFCDLTTTYTSQCGYRSQAPSVNKHNRLPALKSSFMRHFHALSVIMALPRGQARREGPLQILASFKDDQEADTGVPLVYRCSRAALPRAAKPVRKREI
jgi:hypothetical protein